MNKVLLLPGDGIGPEIMAEAKKVLQVLTQNYGLALELEEANLGGVAVDKEGSPYPATTKAKANNSNAILLGAVGGPKWDSLERDMRPETGLLGIRSDLELYANLRPAQVMDALVERSSLKKELIQGLDLLIVRELTGDIYFGEPRGMTQEDGLRVGFNTMRYNEAEVRRIAKVAFEAAMLRDKRLCSVDKMNVLDCSQLWRDVMIEVSEEYPEVTLSHMLVDNAAMQLVRNPRAFDVIVTGNMFGDILSDEASMLTGSIGLLPSASIRGDGVGLYEPIHGSAPDIAGQGLANPLAMILSVAMMLRYSLAQEALADKVEKAVQMVIDSGIRSADLATNNDVVSKTSEIGDAVCEKLRQLRSL